MMLSIAKLPKALLKEPNMAKLPSVWKISTFGSNRVKPKGGFKKSCNNHPGVF